MKRILLLISALYRPFWQEVAKVFVLLLAVQLISVASPLVWGLTVEALITADISGAYRLSTLSLGLFLLQQALNFKREIIELRSIDFDIARHAANHTLKKLLGFSIGQHINENSGLKQSVIGRGQSALNELAHTLIYQVVPTFMEIGLVVCALLFMSLELGLVIVAGITLYAVVTVWMNIKLWPGLQHYEEIDHQKSRQHSEIVRNMELIKSHGQEARIMREYDATQERVFGFGKILWNKFLPRAYARNCITGLTTFAITMLGVYFIGQEKFSPAFFVTFLGWSSIGLARLGNLGGLQRRLTHLYTSIHQYFILVNVPPEVTVVDNPIWPGDFKGGIEFNQVSFQYPVRQYTEDKYKRKLAEPKEIIHQVSFSIHPGEKVAFVGESGAGKSTLVHLLLRAADPTEGRIKIDGEDLRLYDLEKYYEMVGIIPQDVVLFDESLRYNLTFGLGSHRDSISDVDLNEISSQTGLDEFFNRLEHGYDTIIGERGIKLSGGQRQRVGIARALIKSPQILIFDEATSNLDSKNEAIIRSAIDKISKGRTTIIIAHRLSTIKNADHIFVMHRGQLVGDGKHDYLIRHNEPYRELIKHQVQMMSV